MTSLHKKHMAFVDQVNATKDPTEHAIAELRLNAWRQGVEDAGGRLSYIGADIHTMAKHGKDAPMCCGVLMASPSPSTPA